MVAYETTNILNQVNVHALIRATVRKQGKVIIAISITVATTNPFINAACHGEQSLNALLILGENSAIHFSGVKPSQSVRIEVSIILPQQSAKVTKTKNILFIF
jgi:hypothetical protein